MPRKELPASNKIDTLLESKIDGMKLYETTEKVNLSKICQKIKAKLRQRGWDDKKLAEASNVSISTIHAFMNETNVINNSNIIYKLERVLGNLSNEKKKASKPKRINNSRLERKERRAEREAVYKNSRNLKGFNAFDN